MPSYHQITQGELVERLAREHPEREALIYPSRGFRMDYAGLERRSRELAKGLVALGIGPGERVCVWADNRPDWIPLQFALARIGAVLVTANTALVEAEIAYLLKQSRCSAVIAAPGIQGSEYFRALAQIVARGEHAELRHVVTLEPGEHADAAGPGAIALHEVVARGADVSDAEIARLTAGTRVGDAANIQYTSGTTGFPKGVVLTHENLIENAWTVSQVIGVGEGDRLLLQVPLFHCFGCVVSVLGATTHAIPMIALERFDPLRSLEAIQAERATLAYGVPTMFGAMLNHPRFADFDTSSLRSGIMGGAMCPAPLMRRIIDEMGCGGMMAAYGLTEASPAVTMSAADDPVEVRCGTVGRAIPGVEVKIADPETGEERAVGERGELWARGPNIMLGYFENEGATREAITPDGWLRTGDLATLGDDGLFRITGRIKELIIRGGENVYPAEVEDALREHPDVVDAAVFGVPSEELGEEVGAALILAEGKSLDQEAVAAFLETRLAHFKRPRYVRVVDAFPLTSSGKVQRFRLAERAGRK